MKQKHKNEFYINIGFSVFIIVLTLAFFKEYVFQSSSTLVSALSGLIGGTFSFVLIWFIKNKSVIIKGLVLLVYFSFISLFTNHMQTNIININSIKGYWITKEDNLTLTLDINETKMKMLFYPNKKELYFDYNAQGQTIDFFNDLECYNFSWKILKLTNDSLVVMEKEQMLRFTRLH